jgi:hypothetical protein
LTQDQLRRHVQTIRRRGFKKIHCVTLTKVSSPLRGTIARTWSALYEWLSA